MDTNSGTEALNKVVKYGYLPKRRSLTLSQIVTLLLEQLLPDCYQKYLFQNFKLTSFNRLYKAFVPCYLHDRPRDVILHCLDRKSSSRKFSENDIDELENKTGEFQVHGKTRVHTVDLGQASGMPSCTCLDWIKHHIPCKHMFAIFEHKENWSWNNLPQQYLSQPHLCADVSALQAQTCQMKTLPLHVLMKFLAERYKRCLLCIYSLNVTHAISLSLETYCS